MGKTKRKMRKNKIANPTGLPSLRDMEKEAEILGDVNGSSDDDDGDSCAVDKTIENVITKLQSTGVENKDCGCCTVTLLATQKENVQQLLASDIVRVVAPLIVDHSAIVRHSAVTTLKTISGHDDPKFCSAMVDQDVMTPLVTLLKQYSSNWQPMKRKECSSSSKPDSERETFLEAVQLLWNLCENSERAIRIFNKEQLLSSLMPYFDAEVYGHEIAIRVAYCVYTVSEDNTRVASDLLQEKNCEVITGLVALAATDAGTTLLKVLAAGILLNMHCGRLARCPSMSGILKVLAGTIAVNVVPLLTPIAERREHGDKKDHDDGSRSMEWLIAAQEVALEVLVNVCCSDDDGDSFSDSGSEGSDDDDVYCNDVDMENGGGGGEAMKFPLSLPVEVHEALVSHDFVTKVLARINLPDKRVCSFLKKSMLQGLVTIHNHALLCLHNLATCLDVDELGGTAQLYQLWIGLGKLVFGEADAAENVEAVTGAMRAVLQKLAEQKSLPQIDQPTVSDLQALVELGLQSGNPHVRANIVRMVGSLGCILGRSLDDDKNVSLLKTIGTFLLNVSVKDEELWVKSEALDTIFDVFGDDSLDPISVQLRLVDQLKQVLPAFKSKISSNAKCLGEHKPIIMTARTNLVRFLKYKANGLS